MIYTCTSLQKLFWANQKSLPNQDFFVNRRHHYLNLTTKPQTNSWQWNVPILAVHKLPDSAFDLPTPGSCGVQQNSFLVDKTVAWNRQIAKANSCPTSNHWIIELRSCRTNKESYTSYTSEVDFWPANIETYWNSDVMTCHRSLIPFLSSPPLTCTNQVRISQTSLPNVALKKPFRFLTCWVEWKTKHKTWSLTLPYFLGHIEACPFLISSDLFKNKCLSADKFFTYSAGKAVPKTAKAQALKTQETSCRRLYIYHVAPNKRKL